MKFDKLYELALEAAKNFGSPKNIGGGRLQGVKQSTAPSGFVSSSVGKSDNFQERVPIDQKNKKGYDPRASIKQTKQGIEATDDVSGETVSRKKTDAEKGNIFALEGEKSKALFNSFALLHNSPRFQEGMEKIIQNLGNAQSINQKDEKDLKNLRFNITQKQGKATTLRDKILTYQEVLDNYNEPEEVKTKTSEDLSELESLYDINIKNLKKIKGGSKLVTYLNTLENLKMQKLSILKNFTSKTAQYEVEKVTVNIENLENNISQYLATNPQYQNYYDKFKKLSDQIEELSVKHSHHKLKPSDITGVEGKSLGVQNILNKSIEKLKSLEGDPESGDEDEAKGSIQKDKDALAALERFASRVAAFNENLNDKCVEEFKNLVTASANDILKAKFENANIAIEDTNAIDWTSTLPTREDMYNMLIKLSMSDNNNPIFKFVDSIDNWYYDQRTDTETRGAVRHNVDRAMNDNENITVVRDKESLPFYRIANYYKAVKIGTMPISDAIMNDNFRKAYRLFYTICNVDGDQSARWNNGAIKIKLKTLLGIDSGLNVDAKSTLNMGEAIKDHRSINYEKYIDGPYDNRGVGSFKKLLSMVDADLRSDYPRQFQAMRPKIIGKTVTESFDQVANRMASSLTNFDVNDFMIDLQEVKTLLEKKCTGPTKKASSDRKGKKWTKCARQSDGSYKRIHWGQAGVRVGKDNPKRRKSFRARHKCSSAKAGSPKAAACSDW
jgi:hypothetical protein